MSSEDMEKLTAIQTDLVSYMNSTKSEFIRDGITDDTWNAYIDQVNSYGLDQYLEIYQKYFDEFYAEQ
jgi:putative aldouronate transport system substrate-binding protein